MKSLPDQFADELGRLDANGWQDANAGTPDPEVERLVTLARRLRSTPELQVDPAFARHLEQKLHARQATLRLARQRAAWQGWFLPGRWRAHPLISTAAALCLVLLLGVGVLAAAHGVKNPNNPLYGIKTWEQQVQVSLAGSAPSQAELYLQFARDRLDALSGLADGGHGEAYQKTLSDFDQQFTLASQQISSLPAGDERNHLAAELTTLSNDAMTRLRSFLPHLDLTEQLVTTGELGHLGASVPQLVSVEVTLPAHANGQALVTLRGANIASGAQLLVDGKLKTATGTRQGDVFIFVVEKWTGSQHPHSVGILNPDGTAAQTTHVSIKTAPDGGDGSGNGNGGGSGGGNGNGNGGGNGNGNGNSGGENGNKPALP